MKAIIDISEEAVKRIHRIRFLLGGKEDRALQLEVINAIKNMIPFPVQPTNGDVYIYTFHPYKVRENGTCMWIWYTKEEYENGGTHYTMAKEWWNAPYKGAVNETHN